MKRCMFVEFTIDATTRGDYDLMKAEWGRSQRPPGGWAVLTWCKVRAERGLGQDV